MSSKIAQVADAVATLITAQSISGFTVGWYWAREWKRTDFEKTGQITIIPTSRSFNRLARAGVLERPLELSIAVQKCHNGKPGELAPTIPVGAIEAVAEAIGELLMSDAGKIVGTGFAAWCMSVDNPTIAALEHLEELRVVTSVLVASYKVTP